MQADSEMICHLPENDLQLQQRRGGLGQPLLRGGALVSLKRFPQPQAASTDLWGLGSVQSLGSWPQAALLAPERA